ncbi:hypothetical protein N7530_010981 [Penicillium desertorum]|uniref:Uncharacterized protein n=1 Tax=Penicillium desertorum TaxID=1303715 RepID=A0A9X0BH42_9EURO|nr:hypothetical protein N7530_010981 [Penicillium desertorum]
MAIAFDYNTSAQELADMLPTGVAILIQNDESIMISPTRRQPSYCKGKLYEKHKSASSYRNNKEVVEYLWRALQKQQKQ